MLQKPAWSFLLETGSVALTTHRCNISRAYKKGGGGGKEHVTAHPGCGPGESVVLCLNILFTVDRRLTARCSSGCHPSLHSLTGG